MSVTPLQRLARSQTPDRDARQQRSVLFETYHFNGTADTQQELTSSSSTILEREQQQTALVTAVVWMKQGLYDAALEELQRLEASSMSCDVRVLFWLGKGLYHKHRYAEAREYFALTAELLQVYPSFFADASSPDRASPKRGAASSRDVYCLPNGLPPSHFSDSIIGSPQATTTTVSPRDRSTPMFSREGCMDPIVGFTTGELSELMSNTRRLLLRLAERAPASPPKSLSRATHPPRSYGDGRSLLSRVRPASAFETLLCRAVVISTLVLTLCRLARDAFAAIWSSDAWAMLSRRMHQRVAFKVRTLFAVVCLAFFCGFAVSRVLTHNLQPCPACAAARPSAPLTPRPQHFWGEWALFPPYL